MLKTFFPLLLLAGPALAADAELAKCRATTDPAQRLVCYDDVAKQRGAAPTVSTSGGSGSWQVQETVSPVDDSRTVIAGLEGTPIKDKFGRASKPTMILRCKENSTDAYIAFSDFLGSDDTSVLSRWDEEKAQTSSWSISTDHHAVFFPNAIAAIKKIRTSGKLLVQLTPYSESPVMSTFDLSGAAAATAGISDACGWK